MIIIKITYLKLIEICYFYTFYTSFGTDGGTRTHMVSRMILSHVRLPIPPHRHMKFCLKSVLLNRQILF